MDDDSDILTEREVPKYKIKYNELKEEDLREIACIINEEMKINELEKDISFKVV